jgi:hypothetical protein
LAVGFGYEAFFLILAGCCALRNTSPWVLRSTATEADVFLLARSVNWRRKKLSIGVDGFRLSESWRTDARQRGERLPRFLGV